MIQLYIGDCLDIMKQIPDSSVNMVLCDLPYGKTACKWDCKIPLEPLWTEYKRVTTSNAAIILFGTRDFTYYLIGSNLDWYRYSLVWNKGKGSNPLTSKIMPMQSHEDICVFYNSLPTYNPQLSPGKPYKAPRTGGTHTSNTLGNAGSSGFSQLDNTGFRYPLSILEYHIHCGSKHHPAEKPTGLLEYLILTYTNPGDVVLDNAMGSGSTMVACANTGRYGIGIEIDSNYFSVATRRVDEVLSNKSLFSPSNT